MRWSSVFLPFSLLFSGILAKQDSGRFAEFHTKALASSPIKFNDASYKEITAAPRDYSFAVLLTAIDPRFGCQMCREFGPEWDLLSSSWTKGDKAGESKVIFGTLDFNDGRETFMSLGLQTAPVLLYFQPTVGEFAVSRSDPLRFDFSSGQPSAESVHDWIVRHTPGRPHPEFKRPTNYFGAIVSIVVLTFLATLAYVIWPLVNEYLFNRKVMMLLSLSFILLQVGGFMYNNIRNTPYVGQDGRGHISYFAGGFQSQFGMESQIISTLYGFLALTAIVLGDRIPRYASKNLQQVAVITTGVCMLLIYSFLLSIFRMKNGGYPFSLPPFL
ncbi:hypothetical protein M406DRAFT_342893 [Cryphonectria parasitica EP155]|uniref:Uncharacterized protein n=1 Tax=Cryphonectria parasitica (strain ATCC 38755 / EP155) TaxID=660469 RepID=A0A9P4XTS0_CRYP1|nr:uncharacterized protein M406DRAFT_342893 [Cryphonectria parasitica EP155]KAF3760691.1 hypothetical protein M406DRAFT_342893 [Cryphonectria parasitica EP155]